MYSDQEQPNKLLTEQTSDMSAIEVYPQEKIALLEEELVVKRSKEKAGEVVVRKIIETRWVKVPVRREKLIVEQIGDSPRKLAEIDLGQGEVEGIELTHSQSSDSNLDSSLVAAAEFVSPRAASDILAAIAMHKLPGCRRISIQIETANPQYQQQYQELLQSAKGSKE